MGMTTDVDTPNDSLMIAAALRSVQSEHSFQLVSERGAERFSYTIGIMDSPWLPSGHPTGK